MKNRIPILGQAIVSLSIDYQHLSARINRAVDPLKLNMTQMSILSHFSRDPTCQHTIGNLAKIMEMNQPAVTKAVKALVDKRALAKKADDNDARVTYVTITPDGQELLGQAQQAAFPIIAEGFSHLSDEELSQLNLLLDKVKQGLGI